MNLGKLIALLVVFGVLFGIVFYLNSQKSGEQRDLRVAQTTKMFPGLDEVDIFRISVSDIGYDAYILRKNAGVWEVASGPSPLDSLMRQAEENDGQADMDAEPDYDVRDDTGPDGDSLRQFYRADEDKISDLIFAMKELESGQLATSKSEERAALGVMGPLRGTEVHFYDADMNELVGVILGAPEGNYSSTYIRKPEEDDIFKISGNAYMPFQRKITDLRDRQLFDSSPESINAVNVIDTENARMFNLSRMDLEWTGNMEDGTVLELETAKIDDILTTLGSLSVTSFINPQEEMRGPHPVEGLEWDEIDPFGVLAPIKVVSYTTASDETFVLNVGMKTGSNYYAVIGSNYMDVFKVAAAKVNEIAPDPLMLAPGYEPEEEYADLDVLELPEGLGDREEYVEGNIEIIPIEGGG